MSKNKFINLIVTFGLCGCPVGFCWFVAFLLVYCCLLFVVCALVVALFTLFILCAVSLGDVLHLTCLFIIP